MCYYSTTLRADQFRKAKVGEDLVLMQQHSHNYAASEADNKIVCVANGTHVHIESLQFSPDILNFAANRQLKSLNGKLLQPEQLSGLSGRPVSGIFLQRNGDASDWIDFGGGVVIHIGWLYPNAKFYIGEKRVPVPRDLDKAMGLDQLRAEVLIDETPTVERTMARVTGLCSITP